MTVNCILRKIEGNCRLELTILNVRTVSENL